MNTLKTTDNGGFPFVLDDMRWTADGIKAALSALAAPYGAKYIVSGCAITVVGTVVNYSAGVIFMDGELYYVDASTAGIDLAATPFLNVEVITNYDGAGTKVFEDGSVHDTYQINKAQIVGYASLSLGFVSFIGMPTLAEGLASLIAGQSISWTQRQGWAQSPDDAAVAYSGGANVLNATNYGNHARVDIAAIAGQDIKFMTATPTGTWMCITLFSSGSASDTVGINPPTGSSGADKVITPQGKRYLYGVGDTLLFIRQADGWLLCRPQDGNVSEINPINGPFGTPTANNWYSARWGNGAVTLPSQLTVAPNGRVRLQGFANNTLTAGVMPTNGIVIAQLSPPPVQDSFFPVVDQLTGNLFAVCINTSGQLSVLNYNPAVSVNLDLCSIEYQS